MTRYTTPSVKSPLNPVVFTPNLSELTQPYSEIFPVRLRKDYWFAKVTRFDLRSRAGLSRCPCDDHQGKRPQSSQKHYATSLQGTYFPTLRQKIYTIGREP